jgi:hypothetical protein
MGEFLRLACFGGAHPGQGHVSACGSLRPDLYASLEFEGCFINGAPLCAQDR